MYQCIDGYWAERKGNGGQIGLNSVINPENDTIWWSTSSSGLEQPLLSPNGIAGEFRDIRGNYVYYKIDIKGV